MDTKYYICIVDFRVISSVFATSGADQGGTLEKSLLLSTINNSPKHGRQMGATLLHVAAAAGHEGAVRALLEAGVNPDVTSWGVNHP